MKPLSWRLFKVGHCRQLERLTCTSAPWRFCSFPALATLITHPDHGYILFDTGYAPKFFEETRSFPERAYRLVTPVSLAPQESLLQQLNAAGISASEISTVVLSHFHADHISGVCDFPSARIFCSRAGWNFIRDIGRFAGVRRGLIRGLLPDDLTQRTTFFEALHATSLHRDMAPFEHGYDVFGDASLLAIPLPGHAEGQHGLAWVEPSGRTVFLVADAAWSTESIRKCVPPMKITGKLLHHTSDYGVSLRKLHTLHVRNRDLHLIPSHCRERQNELAGSSDA